MRTHLKKGDTMHRTLGTLLLFGLIATTGTAEERTVRNVQFANPDGHSLKLDLYLPDKKNPPLVVWIHGGGWKSGNKSRCGIRWMTEHGFAVASISYRLTDKAIFPAQIHDCKGAIRWLRANSSEYGYSAEKIAVAGSSAGGMLSTLLATSGEVDSLEGNVGGNAQQSSRVDAVIDFYGPVDFTLRARTQPGHANKPGSAVYRLLGGPASEKLELAKLASPAHHVTKDDPPLLIFHGDEDGVVLLDQSERIRDVYKDTGLPVELVIIPGGKHGGQAFYSEENKQKMVAFLNQHLTTE